ncbi:rhomboid family intramembrane serine protease [Oceanobacillus halophilus]|uniref:Rhomboid family intramembrane serine protease n=1 Tax=Oceanobacillus halophilus TaxID=930130 RepID=A0A495AEB9_9BACI|nr:rhomboid family intramembrane serine protease [Oceanobacillus halophilus]RKQ37794.1 rhomboid family intramembrane serine protease [Oceanobacillus halophilus]
MYLENLYTMYKLTYHLVTNNDYELIHMDTNEIWLEKYSKKKSKVVRLTHNGFDWQNHLRKDIAIVFQKVKSMKKLLRGRDIEVHNIYISTYTPVDDWEILKKPMQLKEKKPVKMKIYYLHDEEYFDELVRIQTSLQISEFHLEDQPTEDEMETEIDAFKKYFFQLLEDKRKETQEIFTYGKPRFTYLLITVNLIVFFLLEKYGSSTSIDTLIDFGAKYNPAIIEDRQWWRIFSSMFLHIGLLHLFMNMLAVYYLGTLIERIYGSLRFLLIYFLAGVGGGIASFAFTTSVSAGASGVIFGLFGALLFFGLNYKQIFFRTMGVNVLMILAINIVVGLTVQQIDMAAHLGGLLAGFIASAIFHLPKKKNMNIQLLAIFIYIASLLGFVYIGVVNNLNNQSYHLQLIEKSLTEKNYEDVVKLATTALDKEGDHEGVLLFQRSYAYIELNEIDLAIKDLEESISYESLPEAHYNLALLYYNNEQMEKAEEHIRIAYNRKDDLNGVKDLYEKITGEVVD